MRLKVSGERPKRGVTVDEVAIAVNEERAVGVTIESNSQIGVLAFDFLAQRIDVERAAVEVDVAPIRRSVDCDDVRTETL